MCTNVNIPRVKVYRLSDSTKLLFDIGCFYFFTFSFSSQNSIYRWMMKTVMRSVPTWLHSRTTVMVFIGDGHFSSKECSVHFHKSSRPTMQNLHYEYDSFRIWNVRSSMRMPPPPLLSKTRTTSITSVWTDGMRRVSQSCIRHFLKTYTLARTTGVHWERI